jgi:hypothetical protein
MGGAIPSSSLKMKMRLLKKKREQERDNIRVVAEHLRHFRGVPDDGLAKEHFDQVKAGLHLLPSTEQQQLSELLKSIQASEPLKVEDRRKPREPEDQEKRDQGRGRPARIKEVLLVLWWASVCIGLAAAVVYGIFWVIKTLALTAVGFLGEYVPVGFLQVLVAIGTLAIGSGLYRMRCAAGSRCSTDW